MKSNINILSIMEDVNKYIFMGYDHDDLCLFLTKDTIKNLKSEQKLYNYENNEQVTKICGVIVKEHNCNEIFVRDKIMYLGR